MARVTVEDCITQIPNRFKLVIMAGQRARELSRGTKSTIQKGNDKNPVLALREIAAGTISLDDLEEKVIHNFQYYIPAEDYDADIEEETDEAAWSLQMAELERGIDEDHDDDADDEDLDDENVAQDAI